MGGKEKFIEMFQYFYFMFMTDPFMNTLFDLTNKDTNHDHMAHGKRLGLFFLTWFGDDDEYYTHRGGHPVQNLNRAHTRAKGCPMRGNYKGQGFTYNQVYTWVGYLATAGKAKGFADQYVKKLVDIA